MSSLPILAAARELVFKNHSQNCAADESVEHPGGPSQSDIQRGGVDVDTGEDRDWSRLLEVTGQHMQDIREDDRCGMSIVTGVCHADRKDDDRFKLSEITGVLREVDWYRSLSDVSGVPTDESTLSDVTDGLHAEDTAAAAGKL